MSRLRHISVVRIARITFVLAGGMLLALVLLAKPVEAGCGDYVFVRNASGQLVRASSLMPEHATPCTGPNCPGHQAAPANPEDTSPVPTENPPPKLPCNGPNCSNRSDLPAFPVPPAPTRITQESTALLLQVNDGDQDGNAQFGAAPASDNHELHNPQSIFHPPR